MRIILIFLISIISLFSFSQNTTVKYYSPFGHETTKEKALTYKKITNDSTNLYVEEYHISGRLLMTGNFSSLKPQIENGEFKFYLSSGELGHTGYYKNGRLTGKWEYYDKDGKLLKTIDYGIIDKIKNLQYDNVYESTDSSFNDSNEIKKLVVAKDIVYPDMARRKEIEGHVVVGLILNKDGEITNVEIDKSIDKDLDMEAKRSVIETLHGLKPIEIDGKPVNVRFSIRVKFRLH